MWGYSYHADLLGKADTNNHCSMDPPAGHDEVANIIAGVAASVANQARNTYGQTPLGI
jgi:hypothetical protein